jgi:hypothetical protein
MAKTVVVRLTVSEAVNLSHAVGDSLHSEEDALAIFADDRRAVSAAYRGQRKLNDAIRAVSGFTRKQA